jgi:hypothetical protein
MIPHSIKARGQRAESTAQFSQRQRHPQRRASRGSKATSNPYVVSALAGPYRLEAKLTPASEQTNQVWFDAAVQDQALTPAVECVLFLRVTGQGDPQRVLAGLVSLADASTGYRHQTALRLEQPGRYAVSVAVCDPSGAGGTVTMLWPHSAKEATGGQPVVTTTT